MAKILGGIASSHTPTIGFALDTGKQKDPVWAPIFEGYKPVQQWLADEEARRAVPDLQRPRHVVLLRSLLALRARHRRRVSGRRRGRRAARTAADQRSPEARAAHRGRVSSPTSSTCRTSKARGSITARSRRCRCSGRTSPTWPGAIVPLQVGVLQFPTTTARRCYKLGQVVAQGDRELSRGSQGRDRRHGRSVAPGARRARGLQQHAVGSRVHGLTRQRSREAHEDDDRGVRRSSAAWKAPRSSCG